MYINLYWNDFIVIADIKWITASYYNSNYFPGLSTTQFI